MVAKRMYRFLDKHFNYEENYRRREPVVYFDLEDFAGGHIGLLGDYEPWKIKQKLAAGIRELEAHQIIEPLADEDRYTKKSRGVWQIIFKRGSYGSRKEAMLDAEDASQALRDAPAVQRLPLVEELVKRGVTEVTAENFVREYPASRLTEKIEYLDFLIEKGESLDSPVGWLVDAIRKNYKAPGGYQSKSERERKQQAVEQAQKKKADDLAAKRRREEQETADRKAERAHIDSYLNALTPQERKALEEHALANADDKMRAAAREAGPLGEVARRLLVDREILRIHPLRPPMGSQPTS
jgi:hypothetical protein